MTEHTFGGFWRRAMALFIDKMILLSIILMTLFVGLLALWIGYPLPAGEFIPEDLMDLSVSFVIAYGLMTLLLHMMYFTYFHGTTGQTPGKMVFGLRVIQATGENMTLGIAFLRWVGYFVSTFFCYLGFLWVAFDSKKQGWHDKIAGTVVISRTHIEKYLDKDRDIL